MGDLARDRKRSESRALSLGLLGVGASFVLAGLGMVRDFQDGPPFMIGAAVFVCVAGICLLLAAGVYELFLRRRGQRHSGRIAEVVQSIVEDQGPSETTVRLAERAVDSAERIAKRVRNR